MSIATGLQGLIDTLTAVQADAEKADKGQKAPGTRVRVAISKVTKEGKILRQQVLAAQKKN